MNDISVWSIKGTVMTRAGGAERQKKGTSHCQFGIAHSKQYDLGSNPFPVVKYWHEWCPIK
jgi:hypothetical protein